MIATQTPELQESSALAGQRQSQSWTRFIILVLAVLAIIFNRLYIPNVHYDLLNIIPLLATLYVCYALIALDKTCGQIGYIARCISEDPKVRRPFGAFLFSPWLRSMLLLPLLLVVAEFGFRCMSYQRSELYERQGNLLYTPIPNQEYLEKISLTQSRINNNGLRGSVVVTTGKQIVLCLGDSVTYGYGVDDNHTYPAELQKALDQKFPGRYLVLNGGVDGYPTPFMREKFLYLWNQGIHPDVVVVGYSFNEGGLGRFAYADGKTKDVFASRVRMKNKVRSIALYNIIVERWARASYNRMKKYMVPGTNSRTLTAEDVQNQYEKSLQDMYDTLNAYRVKPVFALFTGYDGRTGEYDNQGPFQLKFRDFAESHGAPLILSNQVLGNGAPPNPDIQKYFQDQCHMKEIGTQKFAQGLAEFLTPILGKEISTLNAVNSANTASR
jgi:lysophospholipase L1-like esterase